MDIIQVEREFTAWIAQILGLEVDTGIFRGGIPSGQATSVCVLFGSEIKGASINLTTFNVQVLGKFSDRDDALRMLHKLNRAIPCYGVSLGDYIFRSIIPRGDSEPYASADDGAIKTYASRRLIVSVLTKGA